MTHTFNPESYANLLVKYQPKPIVTEADNDAAIALAQELEHRPNRTPEESTLLELLLTLIEKFEMEYYPIPASPAHDMLIHLMDARDLDEKALVEILGTRESVAEILRGIKKINQAQAQALAEFFHVDVSLFLN